LSKFPFLKIETGFYGGNEYLETVKGTGFRFEICTTRMSLLIAIRFSAYETLEKYKQ
jgi:hypothetical protein